MYFGMKSYLKSNHYHTPKHPLNRQGPKVTHHTQLYHLGCLIIQEAHLSRKKANRRRRWEHSHVKARFCNRRMEEGEGIKHLMSWHTRKEERRRTNYKIMR
jgi:hypothetical protein